MRKILEVIKDNKQKTISSNDKVYDFNDRMPIGRFKGFTLKNYISVNPESLQWYVYNGIVKVTPEVRESIEDGISQHVFNSMFEDRDMLSEYGYDYGEY